MATINSIITSHFKYRLIKDLEFDFSNSNRSVYFFYGRPIEWNDTDVPNIDLINSEKDQNFVKSNIMALKKIGDLDLILGAKSYTWTSGTTYTSYDDRRDMNGAVYYVLAGETNMDVYKCLDNNEIYGIPQPSTVKPMHVDYDRVEREEDGYVWKYIFSISDPISRKFSSIDFFPLDIFGDDTQAAINNVVPGTVNKLNITNLGKNYLIYNPSGFELDHIPLFISGNGDEIATAKILITDITDEGSIAINNSTPVVGMSGFAISDSGSGYTIIQDRWIPVQIRQITTSSEVLNPKIDISQVEYAYGIAEINNEGGIKSLRIVNPGSNYVQGEAVIVQSSAIGFAEIDPDGQLYIAYIDQQGQNFSEAEVVIISDKPSDENDGTIVPILSPFLGHGSNPEVELNAFNLMANVRIAYEETGGDFSVANDFRSVGLIENVLKQDANGQNQEISLSLTLDAKTSLIMTEDLQVNDFGSDNVIVGLTSGARGRIIDVVDRNTVRIIRDLETSNSVEFQPGESIITSSAGTAVISSVKQPEYTPYSGDILFINNREPIERSNDQIETINFVLTI